MPYLTPHISLLDTTVQTIAVAGTPQFITFDTNLMSHKIVATSSSRLTFNEAGDYAIDVTTHITAGAANKILDIWLRINGVDVANSNSKTLVVNNETKLLTVTKFITVTAGQYLEFWMNGDNNSLSLISYVVGTTPTRPVTPSIRLTIDRLP
jgi:hypothetical protein